MTMNGGDLTSYGQLGATVLVVFMFLKDRKEDRAIREKSDQRLALSIDRNSAATSKNTDSSYQILTFMQKLNGKLDGAVLAKVGERCAKKSTRYRQQVGERELP